MSRLFVVALFLSAALSGVAAAQDHSHTPGMSHVDSTPAVTQSGQAAFAAIAEVVRMLEADSTTDWTRADLEGLRRHLRDMDEVTLRARVRATPVEGGAAFEVTGTGATRDAIRRIVSPHARVLDRQAEYRAAAETTATGVRLTVTTRATGNAGAVAKIRGLGFAGLLTVGDHHGPHHLALARGAARPHEH